MMKKLLLLLGFVATSAFYAQTPSSETITLTQASYQLTEEITFTLTYSGGNDGAGTNYTIENARAFLATRNVGGGGFAQFNSANVVSINGTQNGTDVALMRAARGGTFMSSAELAALPTPREHVIYIQYETSENPGTQIFGTSVVLTLTTPPTIVDAWDFNFSEDIIQANSIEIPIIYTSEDPIAIGGIKFQLQVDTQGVFTRTVVGEYANTAELPAGTNATTTITVSNIPAIYTVENTDGGSLLYSDKDPSTTNADNQLFEANPNGVTDPAYSGAFYRFFGIAGEDPNFMASTAEGFNAIVESPTLSTENFNFKDVNIYPNPTNGIINISGLRYIGTITIYNVLGQQVKNFKDQENIDISSLNKGIYFLKTNNGLKRKVIKN